MAFFWILLVPGSGQEVWGQTRDGGCLKLFPLSSGVPDPLFGPGLDEMSEGEPPPFFVTQRGEVCRTLRDEPSDPAWQAAMDRAPSPGKAFLLSAALPGAGQWFLGQDRWPAYLAVEAWAWLQFLDWRREGRHLQKQYKDMAWFVARRVSTGPRTDAGWEYYEALTNFHSSGAYDSDPLTPGVQPEENPETFNGSIWALAQEIYLPSDVETPVDEESDPYQRAFSYYLSRAYAPELAWDWGTDQLLQEEYGSLIEEADEALRSSTGMVGVILANHLLSAVDALVSGRLGIAGEIEPAVEFLLLPGPYHTQGVALQIRLPSPFANVR